MQSRRPTAPSVSWVTFENGVVVLSGGSLPRERLIAAGATVTRNPDTGFLRASRSTSFRTSGSVQEPVSYKHCADGDHAGA
jgi:hypothetical protein